MKILAALAGADRVGLGEAQKGGTGHAERGIRLLLSTMYRMYISAAQIWLRLSSLYI